jgi:thioredoxin reductase (NADPH)
VNPKKYEIIILGGGAAGLTAALYGCRYGLSVLLLEEVALGGQILTAAEIENYPGVAKQLNGAELIEELENQVRKYPAKIVYERITHVDFSKPVKRITTNKSCYESHVIILATGRRPRKLSLAREEFMLGRGVSYCATCDGNFFRGKPVAVVGGGDTAVTEALFLSNICKKVYLIHRQNDLLAVGVEVAKLKRAPNVEFLLNSQVTALMGEKNLEGIVVQTGDATRRLEVNALFVAIGATPNTNIFFESLELSDDGYIITNEEMETSIPGIFAAGDIRKKSLRQVITAAADGAIAAQSSMLFYTSLKNV